MRISDWSSDVCSSDLQDLAQPLRVCEDMARQARGTVRFEIEPLGRGLKPEHVDDLIEQLGQRDAVAFDAQRSILDPRDVEQTVDQVDEVARTAPDDLDRVFDMLGRVALDQLRIARNDV